MSLFFFGKKRVLRKEGKEEGKREKGQRSVLCFHFFNQSINQSINQPTNQTIMYHRA
jgi:hypothetical protein